MDDKSSIVGGNVSIKIYYKPTNDIACLPNNLQSNVPSLPGYNLFLNFQGNFLSIGQCQKLVLLVVKTLYNSQLCLSVRPSICKAMG